MILNLTKLSINWFYLLFGILLFISCDKDTFGSLDFVSEGKAPENLKMDFDISNDNSGKVTIKPDAQGVMSYDIYFTATTKEPSNINPGDEIEHTYKEGNHKVKLVAFGANGKKAEKVFDLQIKLKAPENVVVKIENDKSISKKVNVTVTADFAKSFKVYFGEAGNDSPKTGEIGGTVSYTYASVGDYNIRVVVSGQAIATTEKTGKASPAILLQPAVSAKEPPNRDKAKYISIYTKKYTNEAGTNFFPDWGQGSQGSSWAEYDLKGDKMLKYINLSYQGIQLSPEINVKGMKLHLDIWTSDNKVIKKIKIFIINKDGPDPASKERFVEKSLNNNGWTSIDIPISDFESKGISGVNKIHQFKFEAPKPWAKATVYIDNIYFYKD